MKGLWQESSMGNIWYFKDSIGYFYLFHPPTNWSLEKDVLKIMNARDLDKNPIIYDELIILEQTKNKLRIKNDDFYRVINFHFRCISLLSYHQEG